MLRRRLDNSLADRGLAGERNHKEGKMATKKKSWFQILAEGTLLALVLVKRIQIWLVAMGAGGG